MTQTNKAIPPHLRPEINKEGMAPLMQMKNAPQLAEDELDALCAVAYHPDTSAEEAEKLKPRIAASFYGLAVSMARQASRYAQRNHDNFFRMLLSGALGEEGLLAALDTFDPDKGHFTSHAERYIMIGINKAIIENRSNPLPYTTNLQKYLHWHFRKLFDEAQKNFPEKTDKEILDGIAQHCIDAGKAKRHNKNRKLENVSFETVREIVQLHYDHHFVHQHLSIDAEIAGDTEGKRKSSISDLLHDASQASPEIHISMAEARQLTREFLNTAKEVFIEAGMADQWEVIERAQLTDSFKKADTDTESNTRGIIQTIAQERGVSHQAVSQQLASAQNKLEKLARLWQEGGTEKMREEGLNSGARIMESPITCNAGESTIDPLLLEIKKRFLDESTSAPEIAQRQWDIYFLAKIQKPSMTGADIAREFGVSGKTVTLTIKSVHEAITRIHDKLTNTEQADHGAEELRYAIDFTSSTDRENRFILGL